MSVPLFVALAVVLGVERLTYAYIWRHPATFHAQCARIPLAGIGGPVDIVRTLFFAFKVIQVAAFATWIYVHADGHPQLTAEPAARATGAMIIVVGQVLNAAVFLRLGSKGVFYGNRFGFELPWVSGFPFSVVSHPQYVGTVLTIWGIFFLTRFPHPGWVALPLLETMYYIAGSYAESDRV
jgi:methylene-fatty-acyl-phospholipid synthase